MLSSKEAAKDFKSHGLKTIGFLAAASASLFIVAQNINSYDKGVEKAADLAQQRFDVMARPLLTSEKAVNIADIDKVDHPLATCILRQNPDAVTILQNGALNTTAARTSIQPDKLRACYKYAAADQAADAYKEQHKIHAHFMMSLIIGGGASGVFMLMNGVGTAISGAEYGIGKFRERKRPVSSASGPGIL